MTTEMILALQNQRHRAAELEAFFNDYSDPNQDPQSLQERANTLKPTPEEWAKYRAPVEVDF